MAISPDALRVLRDCTADGLNVRLPAGAIDSSILGEVDGALWLAGGIWENGAYHYVTGASTALERAISSVGTYSAPPPVVLSYGMGVESTAIAFRWLEELASRDFDLSNLVVLTAQTGDEFQDLAPLVLDHMIPRLQAHNVRWVQVARRGPLRSDGIAVLEDSRSPTRAYLEGSYRLSDELIAAGTVPQVASGRRLCSIKAKGWPLDTWLAAEMRGRAFRHAMGFNAEEKSRATRDTSYSTEQRSSEYPLIQWGWIREDCLRYILKLTGIRWPKSCCVYCPFAHKVRSDDMADHLERWRKDPEAGALALMLERVSLALNPRMSLFAGRTALSVIQGETGMNDVLEAFQSRLVSTPWAVYRVRRLYRAQGLADRRTDILGELGTEHEILDALGGMGNVGYDGGLARVYVLHRGTEYPAREEFYVAAPALPVEKSRPGFDVRWDS